MRTFLLLMLVLAVCTEAGAQRNITITNPTGMQLHRVMEIDNAPQRDAQFIVRDAFGIEQTTQVTHDGKLLLYVSVRPYGEATYTMEPGEPMPAKQYVQGKYYPERADDISFENDRTGFRIYGPETQRRGEKAFGIDLWVKHSSELLVDSLYRLEFSRHPDIAELRQQGKTREADSLTTLTSYHLDHGAGMDGYGVGPTLGCGTPVLMVEDSLCYPWCYETYEILDNGPLRFTLRLDFPDSMVNGMHIKEHRQMELDRGSNFCKMTVWYDGLEKPVDLAAGVALRQSDTTSVVLTDNYVAYADPTIEPEKHNSQIYVAVLFPDGVDETCKQFFCEPKGANVGHILGILRNYDGRPYTYYVGMAWSDFDVRSFEEWQLRVNQWMASLTK